jgi:hypothetical protein
MRKRVFTKSPVRENCTPGSVRGLLGNWQSYRDLCGQTFGHELFANFRHTSLESLSRSLPRTVL